MAVEMDSNGRHVLRLSPDEAEALFTAAMFGTLMASVLSHGPGSVEEVAEQFGIFESAFASIGVAGWEAMLKRNGLTEPG